MARSVSHIAGLVHQHCRGCVNIYGQHALLSLLLEIGLQHLPDGTGSFGGSGQKRFVSCIRNDIACDEIANFYAAAPVSRLEVAPGLLVPGSLGNCHCSLHGAAPPQELALGSLSRALCHPLTQVKVWEVIRESFAHYQISFSNESLRVPGNHQFFVRRHDINSYLTVGTGYQRFGLLIGMIVQGDTEPPELFRYA